MTARTARQLADRYVDALADLNPLLGTALGVRPHDDRLPDLSPDGIAATDDLARSTLAELDALPESEDPWSGAVRGCCVTGSTPAWR
ncbi:MAG: hypothetical protein WKF47_13040 [Geodermatophilaceae bacterium]